MNQEESRCVVCEAGFRPNVMVGDKCKPCSEKYPNAHNREDIVVSRVKAKTLSDETVKEIVYEILEEAGIKRIKCEKCSKLVFRTSPAQKVCTQCREKEGK